MRRRGTCAWLRDHAPELKQSRRKMRRRGTCAWLRDHRVRALVAHKRWLVEVLYTATLSHTVNVLVSNNIVTVPVAAPPSRWIGAGGSMILESDQGRIWRRRCQCRCGRRFCLWHLEPSGEHVSSPQKRKRKRKRCPPCRTIKVMLLLIKKMSEGPHIPFFQAAATPVSTGPNDDDGDDFSNAATRSTLRSTLSVPHWRLPLKCHCQCSAPSSYLRCGLLD
ncbi:uncharacterized protein A4U43_C05F15050 [Asparagus officinalis]|uniref:Uncharacterized protein n=1 Tax=Asparagus officinalis TaxID=4686 RepID=A0A5P1EU94_ASPOF|nr:uncharacterized protein A4U43_C05F15050 [Asparagus officinalis]